jgi:glutamate N-acetyltransferase/amino-acid N-acetyltransferase
MTQDKKNPVPQIPIPENAVPSGFRFAAVRAGIKASGNPDLACAIADASATAAAMFTSNRVVAAPVVVGREHLRSSTGKVRVVLVNAGNANCATGEAGIAACQSVCQAAATQFSCAPQEVFPSSTGIIGVPLPSEKLIAALPEIAAKLGPTAAHLEQFSQAILTTDTRAKVAHAQLSVSGASVCVLGVAKGAGMIFPQLVPHATMLVYLFTDAAIAASDLLPLLHGAVDGTFNRISIDGDTSTNDTVLLLASGASGVRIAPSHATKDTQAFADALQQVCSSLARQVIEDGEGVGHVVELLVEDAATQADALRVARSIAHSPLVKTAWAGSDPNWGRILAAIGYSGVAIDPARISIRIGGQLVCFNGGRAPGLDADRVHTAMQGRNFQVRVSLGMGSASCNFLTTDLTAEYVRINAEYST